jgi:hypothetical protein
MKTLTAFTAVATLIAGISIASAAGMEKNNTMGSGKFCISGAGGALNCQYASLAACQKAAKASETCKARPSSTTGSKY